MLSNGSWNVCVKVCLDFCVSRRFCRWKYVCLTGECAIQPFISNANSIKIVNVQNVWSIYWKQRLQSHLFLAEKIHSRLNEIDLVIQRIFIQFIAYICSIKMLCQIFFRRNKRKKKQNPTKKFQPIFTRIFCVFMSLLHLGQWSDLLEKQVFTQHSS